MKKFLCILLSLIMLCLTACNTGKPSGTESSTPKTGSSQIPEPSESEPGLPPESSSLPGDSTQPENSIDWSYKDIYNLYHKEGGYFVLDTPEKFKAFFTQKNDYGVVYSMSLGVFDALVDNYQEDEKEINHFSFCNKILNGEITLQLPCVNGEEIKDLGCLYAPHTARESSFNNYIFFMWYYSSNGSFGVEYLTPRLLEAIEGKPLEEALEIISSKMVDLSPDDTKKFLDIEMDGRVVPAMKTSKAYFFIWDNILVQASTTLYPSSYVLETLKTMSFTPVLLPD